MEVSVDIMRPKRTIFITLPPLLKEAFYRYAEMNDISASSLGRKLVEDFLLEKGVVTERMIIDAKR